MYDYYRMCYKVVSGRIYVRILQHPQVRMTLPHLEASDRSFKRGEKRQSSSGAPPPTLAGQGNPPDAARSKKTPYTPGFYK